jgi:hypothetical protein
MATNPHVSRRSLLTAASAALAGTAVAAIPASAAVSTPAVALTSPAAIDPALVAIGKCQDVLKAYQVALHERDYNENEDYDILEDRVYEASDASLDAWRALFNVTPTTLAGAAALATYMLKYHREEGGTDTAEEALEGLAGGLRRFAAAVGQGSGHV